MSNQISCILKQTHKHPFFLDLSSFMFLFHTWCSTEWSVFFSSRLWRTRLWLVFCSILRVCMIVDFFEQQTEGVQWLGVCLELFFFSTTGSSWRAAQLRFKLQAATLASAIHSSVQLYCSSQRCWFFGLKTHTAAKDMRCVNTVHSSHGSAGNWGTPHR